MGRLPVFRKHGMEAFSPHPDLRAGFRQLAPASAHPKGMVLFQQGHSPKGVFLLESGKARLTMSATGGRTLTFRTVGPGYLLGLPASILDKPYLFTARLLQESSVIFIPQQAALRLLRERSDLCFDVLQQLGRELTEMPPTVAPPQTRRRRTRAS